MCSIWGGFLSLASILDFQHCTDEAQKAETVLSAVSLILVLYKFNLIIIVFIIINIIVIINIKIAISYYYY